MMKFKEFLEDVRRETGYGLSKDDIESAKRMAKAEPRHLPDSTMKEIVKVKNNIKRWEKQLQGYLVPSKRYKILGKLRDAKAYLRGYGEL